MKDQRRKRLVEEALEKFKSLFKEYTGLDYNTCTDEEYNEWYHDQLSEASKDNKYTAEILTNAERIIENKDYPQLTKILENYDTLVKEKSHMQNLKDHPYWCYTFVYRPDQDEVE